MAEKLIKGEEGKTPEDAAQWELFYQTLFEDLVGLLTKMEEKHYTGNAARVPNEVAKALEKIDPGLIVFYVQGLNETEIGKVMIKLYAPAFAVSRSMLDVKFIRRYCEVMKKMARVDFDKAQSIARLMKPARLLGHNYITGIDDDLSNLLLNHPGVSIADLSDYWFELSTGLPCSAFCHHPILSKLLSEGGGDFWAKAKPQYLKLFTAGYLPDFSGDFKQMPLMKRLVDEINRDEPELLYQIAEAKYRRSTDEKKPVLDFLLELLRRYAESPGADKGKAEELAEKIRRGEEYEPSELMTW